MRTDIRQGHLTIDKLNDMLEKVLAERYKASRFTVREARNVVLADKSQQTPTNDN
jgi:DNA-binding GntR family transcriptional regulator